MQSRIDETLYRSNVRTPEREHRDILNTFTEKNLPDLDVAVLGALELFAEIDVPTLDLNVFKRPLILGSVNAFRVGQVLGNDHSGAVFANESNYQESLERFSDIDGAIIVSASGSKHAIDMAKKTAQKGLTTWLITNNENAPAKEFIDSKHVYIFPKNREPYTYNTSTYMGMLLGKTGERAESIHTFIREQIEPCIPDNFARYNAFFLIVPSQFEIMREMIVTKFDELFGPQLVGRAFSFEQTKHAKTIIPSDTELFISFGEENTMFGNPDQRLHIPLPDSASFGAMMAVSYYVIGYIQKQFPPYFKDNIIAYTKQATEIFGHEITPIVE